MSTWAEHADKEDLARVRAKVTTAIDAHGSARAFAAECGISEGHLSDYLLGRRLPPYKVLARVGMRKVIRYEPVP